MTKNQKNGNGAALLTSSRLNGRQSTRSFRYLEDVGTVSKVTLNDVFMTSTKQYASRNHDDTVLW